MDPSIKYLEKRIVRGSPVPLYRQLREAIVEGIRSKRFPAGSRLPATRTLARELGLNRTTVCTAYEALESDGYVASHVGRGTVVMRTDPAESFPAGFPLRGPAGTEFSEGVRNLLRGMENRSPEPPGPPEERKGIDFSRLLPDERLFPVRQFRGVVHQILTREGSSLLQYGAPSGYSAMRKVLAGRLSRRGLPADSGNLLIVSGAQQGMDIVFRMFLDPENIVVVESPTYSQVLPLLRFHRARIVGVPMTPDGMDLDVLESVLRSTPVRMIYTMPSLHNPTGVTTGPEHRRRLLGLAGRYRVPVLEDGFEEDLRTGGKKVLPLQALDRQGLVIYLGTFSKGLFPGLRIGWLLAASRIIRIASGIKSCSDYHTSLLSQAALAEFCRLGHYDSHLGRLQKIFRRRLRIALRVMQTEFPGEVRWTPPEGGYCIWIELPSGLSSERLWREGVRQGVRVAPGQPFFDEPTGRSFFRISISRVDEEEIREGIQRLGKVLREMVAGRREPPKPADRRESMPYI